MYTRSFDVTGDSNVIDPGSTTNGYIDFVHRCFDPGSPWGTRSPQKRAYPQTVAKMEPKFSPGPSSSSRWAPQGFQNGAPDIPKTPKMETKRNPERRKWSLVQGSQNDTKINQASSQINTKVETKLDPPWGQPGFKLWFINAVKHLEKTNVTTRLTQKKGGGGVSP